MRLRERYQAFKQSRPGQRFTELYERRNGQGKSPFRPTRLLILALGLALVAAGLFFMVMPGPGLIPAFFGCALLAMESRFMARWLDRGELLLRKWGPPLRARWKRLPAAVRWLAWLLGAGVGLTLSVLMIRSWIR